MVFPLLVSPKQLPEYSPLCLFFTLFFYYFLMPLLKTLARYFFGNRQDIEISCFPHCLHTIVMRKVPIALESKPKHEIYKRNDIRVVRLTRNSTLVFLFLEKQIFANFASRCRTLNRVKPIDLIF